MTTFILCSLLKILIVFSFKGMSCIFKWASSTGLLSQLLLGIIIIIIILYYTSRAYKRKKKNKVIYNNKGKM